MHALHIMSADNWGDFCRILSRSEMWVPKRGGLKAAGKRLESATFLQRSFFDVAVQFSFAAAQLVVQMTSALQQSQCCSAVPAAQHSENCSATSVFACGMLQGWGLEGSGLGLAEILEKSPKSSADKVYRASKDQSLKKDWNLIKARPTGAKPDKLTLVKLGCPDSQNLLHSVFGSFPGKIREKLVKGNN